MIQVGCVVTCFLGVGIIAKPRFILDLISVNNTAAQPMVFPEDLRKGNLTQLGFASALAGVLGGVVRNPDFCRLPCGFLTDYL